MLTCLVLLHVEVMFETLPEGRSLHGVSLLYPLWISVHNVSHCFRAVYLSFVMRTRYVEQVLFTGGKKPPQSTSKYGRREQSRSQAG